MTKDFIKMSGIAAILIAVALNVKHAGNDYGIRDNSLWSEVAAQSSSSEGGTNHHFVYCLWEACIGLSNREECFNSYANDYEECYFFTLLIDPNDPDSGYEVWLKCFYIYGTYPPCEYFFGKTHKCTTEYHDPALFEVRIVTECWQCENECIKPDSSTTGK